MAMTLGVGQLLKGKSGVYNVLKALQKDVWTAIDSNGRKVIAKTAPKHRLDIESAILHRFQGNKYFRRLIDEVEDPPSIIMEYLDDNALSASQANIQAPDIRFVAKSVLEALASLHKDGYVHTDVKPDNILLNYCSREDGTQKFSRVVLADYGSVFRVDLDANPKDMMKEDGHVISAAIFRSPEAMLNLRWGTATDIWSFGATLISLIWGKNFHIFKPEEASIEDGNYPLFVMVKQVDYFGPFPSSYVDICDEERLKTLTFVNNFSKEQGSRMPFSQAEDSAISVEDREFIGKIMKMDPRERPTASQLLEDEWFKDGKQSL